MELYHYWRSSASWRVRWGLEIKRIPHMKIPVNLLDAEEKSSNYLSKNPAGYVPCLMVNGNPLGESLAILEWLEETYPNPSFFDGNNYKRALIRQLAETINSGIQPLQNLDVLKKISSDKNVQTEWVQFWIKRGLGIYEKIISAYSTNFSVSDHPTVADLCLVPQCHAAHRFQVDLAPYPRIQKIYDHSIRLEECYSSRPEAFEPPLAN